MTETKQQAKDKNRIVINLSSSAVEVESSTESLKEVYKVADELMSKVSMGASDEESAKKRIKAVGIN